MEDCSKELVIKNGCRRYKSVIAAYASGKLSLHGIVHPSRLTGKNIQRHLLNHLDLNSYTVAGKPLRANRRKRPLLRDYINGTVPVTAMLAPEKITDISAKREGRKKITQVQNFLDWEGLHRLSSQANKPLRSWWKSTNYSTTIDKNTRSACQRESNDNDTQKKTPKISENNNAKYSFASNQYECTEITNTGTASTSASRISVWTLSTSSLKETNDNNLSADLTTSTNETVDHETKQAPINDANDDKNSAAESYSDVKFEHASTKDELFVSIQKELLPGEGPHNPTIHFGKNKQYSDEDNLKLNARILDHLLSHRYAQKYFLMLLQNHKAVEQRLLKQIIRMRKDRDRYRNSYNNLRKIHKILANRWYEFRKIDVD